MTKYNDPDDFVLPMNDSVDASERYPDELFKEDVETPEQNKRKKRGWES